MKLVSGIPLLLSVLVGLVLGLVTWEVVRLRRRALDDALLDANSSLLLGFLVVAAFALGVFLTYVLLGLAG